MSQVVAALSPDGARWMVRLSRPGERDEYVQLMPSEVERELRDAGLIDQDRWLTGPGTAVANTLLRGDPLTTTFEITLHNEDVVDLLLHQAPLMGIDGAAERFTPVDPTRFGTFDPGDFGHAVVLWVADLVPAIVLLRWAEACGRRATIVFDDRLAFLSDQDRELAVIVASAAGERLEAESLSQRTG